MKSKSLWILIASVALLSVSVPLFAHHSVSAEFDTASPITFTGTIKKVDWMNPHIYTHIEVQTPDGPVTYMVEGGAPNSLFRRGWRKDSAKIGEVVTVEGIRARNPESFRVGRATISTADGVRLYSGDAPK